MPIKLHKKTPPPVPQPPPTFEITGLGIHHLPWLLSALRERERTLRTSTFSTDELAFIRRLIGVVSGNVVEAEE